MIQISLTFGNAQIWLDRMDHDPLLLLDKKVDGEQCRLHLDRIWRCCLSDHPAVRKPYDVVLTLKIIILGVRKQRLRISRPRDEEGPARLASISASPYRC